MPIRYRLNWHLALDWVAIDDWVSTLTNLSHVEPDTETVPYSLNLSVDWRNLPSLDVHEGALAGELECLRLICDGIGRDIPVYMTLFGPLTLAGKLAGRHVVDDIRHNPDALHGGLETITETMIAFTQTAREAGVDGLYFATQYASETLLTEDEHAEFGEPYDLVLLRAWGDAGPVILHLCGADVFFDLCNIFPVQAVCWDHGLSQPSFSDAFDLTDRVLVAGMEEREFPISSQTVGAQASDALVTSQGMRHILAPTCVIPAESSDQSLAAVVEAVEGFANPSTA